MCLGVNIFPYPCKCLDLESEWTPFLPAWMHLFECSKYFVNATSVLSVSAVSVVTIVSDINVFSAIHVGVSYCVVSGVNVL